MNGHPAPRFRLFIASAEQVFEFFTLAGARAYLPVYHAETGRSIDYYHIRDKDTDETVESQAGRTE